MKSSAYVIEIEQAEKETKRTMLNTRHKIATQITTISQLTNNWNELEEDLKKYDLEYLHETGEHQLAYAIESILDKMKEIKGE